MTQSCTLRTGTLTPIKVNGIKANTDKSKVMVFGSTNCLKNLPDFDVSIDDFSLAKVPRCDTG